ncbi:hypothetical protein BB559_002294 [Furculomyces boomerangus]|uniref:Rhodanese domain-containing protein n=2 Tax=Harpellales TaxID=61421 RepID=A0A2T9YWJ7_9FUNG|nr:hypothetical protein BB559_002294 [Furculomyces boomerangus]PWA02871.1 hypothetical protein BB558_000966 [Smittium angustum]
MLRSLFTCGASRSLARKYSSDSPSRILDFVQVRKIIHGMTPIQYALIDVREPAEVQEGKIPTSTNIPLGEVVDAFQSDEKSFAIKYGIPKPNPNVDVIFYCKSGFRSQKAFDAIEKLGLNLRLFNYKGSWSDYEKNTFK